MNPADLAVIADALITAFAATVGACVGVLFVSAVLGAIRESRAEPSDERSRRALARTLHGGGR